MLIYFITITTSFAFVSLQEYVDEFLILFGFVMLQLFLHLHGEQLHLLMDEYRENCFNTQSKSSSMELLQIISYVVGQ